MLAGFDYLVGVASQRQPGRGYVSDFLELLTQIGTGHKKDVYDLDRTADDQLKEFELTAVKVFGGSIRAAVEHADEETLKEVLRDALRLACRIPDADQWMGRKSNLGDLDDSDA